MEQGWPEIEPERLAQYEGAERSAIKKLHFVTYFAGINELHCHFPKQGEAEIFQTGPKHCQPPRRPAQKQLFFITPEMPRSPPASPKLNNRPTSSLTGLDFSSRYATESSLVDRRRHPSSARRTRESLSPRDAFPAKQVRKRLSSDRSSRRSKRGNLSRTSSNPGRLDEDPSPLQDSSKLDSGRGPMFSSSFQSCHAPTPVTSVWSHQSGLQSAKNSPGLSREDSETSTNRPVRFRKFRKEFVDKYGIKVTPPRGDEWIFKQQNEEKEMMKANKELAIKWGTPYPREVQSMSSYKIVADGITTREKKGIKWRKRGELSRHNDDTVQAPPDEHSGGPGRRGQNCEKEVCFLDDLEEQTYPCRDSACPMAQQFGNLGYPEN